MKRVVANAGFTLIELLVAMGLLSAFLVMLVQLLGTSASLFDRGERGQELADRALTAQRAVTHAITQVVGPRTESNAGEERAAGERGGGRAGHEAPHGCD